MHGLILRLECEDVLGTVCPSLPVVRIDMCHHPRDAIFVIRNGLRIGVEVARSLNSDG